ncbi:MFS transporter [Micromonospora antibiotica]|uniref:Tetracycline resistance protein n=1 Tax=Micromonospora antibiotica TaxID=2807623 RepID=A0ABS3VFD9_9ACTN|nr:MFS transporter [Micromonospora antibiotica]MBO4164287.1 MFS transporter [Micromonospora antibiotica]
MSVTVRSTAPSLHASPTAGWRLGFLYGPAVYGVSAAAVALPAAAQGLHVDPAAAVWILAIHALGLGVGAAVAGRATDIWGTRSVLAVGAALLVIGTAVCAVAPALLVVIGGRALLAAGSGAMTATALALAAGAPDAIRPRVLTHLGMVMTLFSATAPLAGSLALVAGWRVALVLPALSVTAIPMCWILTRSGHRQGPGDVDWVGALLLALVASGLLLVLESTTAPMARPLIPILLTATGAGGLLLALHTKRRPAGFLPAVVIRDRRFWHCGLVGASVYGGLFATVYAVPQLLTGLGHTAEAVGMLLLPGAVAGVVVARLAAAASLRLPPQQVMAAIAALFSAAVLIAAADRQSVTLVGAASAGFAAFAVAQMTLTTAISQVTDVGVRGAALGLANLTFFLGGALGAATCAALWALWGLPAAFAATAALPTLAALAAWHLGP